MTTCENCGCRVYEFGCENCNEDAYMREAEDRREAEEYARLEYERVPEPDEALLHEARKAANGRVLP